MTTIRYCDIFSSTPTKNVQISNLEKSFDPKYKKLVLFMDKLAEINPETVDSFIKEIKNYKSDVVAILMFLSHLLNIRVSQKDSIKKVAEYIDKQYKIPRNVKNQYLVGRLFSNTDNTSELKTAIFNDNVVDFIKYTSDIRSNKRFIQDFEMESLFKTLTIKFDRLVEEKGPLFFKISEFIALCGASKCFKAALQNSYLKIEEDFQNMAKFAVAGDSDEIIKALLEKGVSFDNCAQYAMRFHRHKRFQWLLDNYKIEPLIYNDSVENYNDRCFFYIFLNKIDTTKAPMDDAFVLAAQRDKYYLCKYMAENKGLKVKLEARLSMSVPWKEGCDITTALHVAVENENDRLLSSLVNEWKVKPNIRNNLNQTPLHVAVDKKNLKYVKFLVLNAGADVNIRDSSGRTPVMIAALRQRMDIIDFLVKSRANLTIKDKRGTTGSYYIFVCEQRIKEEQEK